jgi:transposase
MNSYETKFRKRVVQYLDGGHTYRETAELFGISTNTLVRWMNMLRKNGNLMDAKPVPVYKKLPSIELVSYLSGHPDAYQTEIAEHFNCAQPSVSRRLRKLGYRRKKR